MAKATVSDAQLMEIGEAVRNGMTPILAIRHFGLSKGVIYRGLRHYEKQTGIKLIGPSQVQKAQMIKAGLIKGKKTRGRKASKANGTGTALATVGEPWQARALEAERRAEELKDQLELATDEVHTLQKIIITLGRAL